MKLLKVPHLHRLAYATIVIALTLAFVIPASATSPIVRPYIGYTKIKLSDEFVDRLNEAGITATGIKPAYLNLKQKVIVLPLVGGLVDLVNVDLELSHTGGLAFTSSDGNTVPIYNFMISNLLLQDPFFPMYDFEMFPIMPTTVTGLVVFDGDMIEARDPFSSLFTVEINAENMKTWYNTLVIHEVPVTLELLASILNGLSTGSAAFEAGQNVGTAQIFMRYYGQQWNH